VDIRLDSAGLRVVPLRVRPDAHTGGARTARATADSDVARAAADVADVPAAHDLVRAVAAALRGRSEDAAPLHGTERAAVLSLLA
jgi:hypothetical protein